MVQPAGVCRRGEGVRKCSGSARRCAGACDGLRRRMHRAACGCASGLRGGAKVLGQGVRKCSGGAHRCAGTGADFRRGMCCEGGEECIAQPAGVRRRGEGELKCSGRACRCAGAGADLRWGMGCEVGGRASSLRGEWKWAGRVRRCAGREQVFGGKCVVRSAGLTHFRRSGSCARVLLYIRPPCSRREIAAMGTKRRSRECSSPAKTSAFAPSAFTLPRPSFTLLPHGLRRRPRRLWPSAAIVIHNGLSTEKLSTSLLAALCKTFSPSRLRTRIYNISFARRLLPGSVRAAPEKSPRRCGTVSRAAVRRVGEGEGKGGRPLAQCRTMPLVCRITVRKGGSAQGKPRPCPCALPAATCLRPRPCPLMGELPCTLPAPVCLPPNHAACMPNHCAQRRKCTRPTPPLPVRSPRGNLSTAEPPVCLPPRPRRLNGHPASAGGRENDRMAHRRTATPTHRTPRGNDTCTIRVPRRKGAQSVVHNL